MGTIILHQTLVFYLLLWNAVISFTFMAINAIIIAVMVLVGDRVEVYFVSSRIIV